MEHTKAPENRINLLEKGKPALKVLYGLSVYLEKSPVPRALLDLVYYRVSQINRCAFCLDMHSKDLLAAGESEQRLLVMDAWRETPFYSAKERAALAWAEALTRLDEPQLSGTVYREARAHFTEEELIDLTMAVVAINSYNRLNIAFSPEVGTYQPGAFASAKANW